MADSHRIRLRGPWECQPLANGGDQLPPATRVQFPATWEQAVVPDCCGCVRFTRHFHRPDGLDTDETVWLMSEGIAGLVGMTLNGRPIAFPAADVTAELHDYNELVLDVEHSAGAPSPIGEVWLEIRSDEEN